MINECNTVLSHHEARDMIATAWQNAKMTVRRELPLPSGRVADVIGCTRHGDLYIAEVKTTLKDSLMKEAWQKYSIYANYCYMAVPALTPGDLRLWSPTSSFPQPWHRLGLMRVSKFEVAILRTPSYRSVPRALRDELHDLIYHPASR